MSRRGNCHHKAVAESLPNRFEPERISRRTCRSREEARRSVFERQQELMAEGAQETRGKSNLAERHVVASVGEAGAGGLSTLARQAIADGARRVLVSAAGLWEIATRHRLGQARRGGGLA